MRFNKLKISKLTIIAICLLFITGIIFYYEEIKTTDYNFEAVSVVIAVKDIKENTVITTDMIKMDSRYKVDISKQTDTILTYAEALGKRTKVPLYQGEVVSKNRIIEDKPWMSKSEETQISLNLFENDRAIDIVNGDYIDLWVEPKVEKDDTNNIIEAKKTFEKLSVVMVYDTNYQIMKTDDFVPAYLTVQLNDNQLKELLEIDKSKYNIRITKYGEDQFYNVIEKNLKEGD